MRLPNPVVSTLVALACAAPGVTPAQEVPARWGAYSVELLDEGGRVLPTFQHRGRTHVLGALGQRYLVRIRNRSWSRAEVVVSVDGRDVIDGRPASFERRGYVVEPQGELTVDGYRLSEASVAAFRFSTVPRSYAARKGDARDVGVIGVAVFAERAPARVAPSPSPEVTPPAEPRLDDGRAAPGSAEAGATAKSEAAPRGDLRERARRGLGTEFGEEHESRVVRVSFERASSRPEAVLTLRYDDRAGLLALGIDVDRDARWARRDETRLRETADPFRGERYCDPPAGWRASRER